jgi:hypothetical protein
LIVSCLAAVLRKCAAFSETVAAVAELTRSFEKQSRLVPIPPKNSLSVYFTQIQVVLNANIFSVLSREGSLSFNHIKG